MPIRTHFLTLVAPYPICDTHRSVRRAVALIQHNNAKHITTNPLSDTAIDILFTYDGDRFDISALRPYVDCGMGKIATRQKKIFISDMDSTMIAHETLDEVANYLGLGEKISAITARSMAGKVNFESSLRQRVRLLAGKDYNAFDTIHKGLIINNGAEITLKTLKKQGIKTALVSGGFDTTVALVAKNLGFDYTYANTLEVKNGKITGQILGTIVGAESKKDILLSLCKKYHTSPEHSIAIGDGANDLHMIHCAGMGIGYMGKKIVCDTANFQINHTDLTTVLYFMGIKKSYFC